MSEENKIIDKIHELNVDVKSGFAVINQKLDDSSRRIEILENKMDGVEEHIDSVKGVIGVAKWIGFGTIVAFIAFLVKGG